VNLTGSFSAPAGGTLAFTGVNGGYLKISSALTNTSAVKVGNASASPAFGYDGFVELDSGASDYRFGTYLESGYLLLGASSNFGAATPQGPIGSGPLTVPSYAHSPALSVTSSGAVIQNDISLGSNLFVGTSSDRKYFLPTNADFPFTLSGVISGSGGLSFSTLSDATLTLSGANTFTGGFVGNFGNVIASSNTAFGTGMLNLESTFIQFTTSAPQIGGITGSYGGLSLSPNSTLQINQQQAGEFGGIIDGSNITVTKTGSAALTLSGGSTYSGTTNVNQGKLILASSSYTEGSVSGGPVGSSTIALNGGELQILHGNSINNPIVFSAPSRLTGNASFGAPLTIGTNATLAPGASPGIMTFASGLTFASGGVYEIDIQSATGSAGLGYDTLAVTGTLAFTSTPASPFRLDLLSLSTSGAAGAVADFSAANSYSWMIATTSGGVTGFNPSAITINATGFTNALSGGAFSVSASGNSLFLNFTPVPEPSTWALLTLGLGGIAISITRRRKSRR
jgi:autotransporter-associated beta strand protein